MIELRNLTKYYPTERGRKYVFRDLNVTFPGGHSIGQPAREVAGGPGGGGVRRLGHWRVRP